jgi:hypothetical protein
LRTGPVVGQDIKTYDVGTFIVGTTDGTAVNWSKLWVEYDVILMNPQLPAIGASSLIGPSVQVTSGGGSISNAGALFGATPVILGQLGVSFSSADSGTLVTLAAPLLSSTQYINQYMIVIQLTGSGITLASTNCNNETGGTFLNSMGGGNAFVGTTSLCTYAVTSCFNGAGPYTFVIAYSAGTVTKASMLITPMQNTSLF